MVGLLEERWGGGKVVVVRRDCLDSIEAVHMYGSCDAWPIIKLQYILGASLIPEKHVFDTKQKPKFYNINTSSHECT